MRSSRRPGDLPLPRPVPRGQAGTIYQLGRAAGEREARQLLEQLRQELAQFGGLSRTEYWQVYTDVMADLAGAEVEPEPETRPAPTESDPYPSMPSRSTAAQLDPPPSMPLIEKSVSDGRTSGSCAPHGTRHPPL